MCLSGFVPRIDTIRFESGQGILSKRAALTTLKMAVFAPMPRPSMARMYQTTPGCRRSDRQPNLMSETTPPITRLRLRIYFSDYNRMGKVNLSPRSYRALESTHETRRLGAHS